jgi:SET domain-containing protein
MNQAFKRNLTVKKTDRGFGVFVKGEVPANTVIFEFQGEVIPSEKIPQPLTSANDYYLQISPDKWLGPSGSLDDLINHSCNPNCGVHIVGDRAFLKSLYLIKAGIEVTFDYSTTSTDSTKDWSLSCQCGSYGCRKTISGFQYLNQATKDRYKKLGVVPKYLMGE